MRWSRRLLIAKRPSRIPRTDDDTVQQIAQQYGLDEDTVRDKLDVIATFGDYTAVNGSLSDEADTDGKSEVTLENGTSAGTKLSSL
jgi:hypothetical protein